MSSSIDISEQLLRLKQNLEKERTRQSELQGEYKSALRQLSEEFGVSSIEQAEEKLQEIQKELDELDSTIQERLQGITFLS